MKNIKILPKLGISQIGGLLLQGRGFSNYIIADEYFLEKKNEINSEEELSEYRKMDYVELPNLSRINILIGANNCGKSRFLRTLFKNFLDSQKKISRYGDDLPSASGINLPIAQKKDVIDKIEIALKDNDHGYGLDSSKGLDTIIEQEIKGILFNNKNEDWIFRQDVSAFIEKIRTEIEVLIEKTQPLRSVPDNTSAFRKKQRQDVSLSINSIYSDIIEKSYPLSQCVVTYIPPLRTARSLLFHETIDSNKIEHDVKIKEKLILDHFYSFSDLSQIPKDYIESIFTGETLFSDIQKLKTSGSTEEKLLKNFERFVSETFFKGDTVSFFPKKHTDASQTDLNYDLFISIGEEEEYPAYELGDGILQIILLTYPLFKNQNKQHFYFLEEPELYLHPGFQKIFMNLLLSDTFKNTQAFLVTHSNHILNTINHYKDEASIYHFERFPLKGNDNRLNPYFTIQNVNNNLISVLDSIGVSNSSVLMANCTIWIEGVTDRKYIKKFLELYFNQPEIKSKYISGYHYEFVEYAGANLSHWDFSKEESDEKINAYSISNKIFLIADKDSTEENPNSEKSKRYKLLARLLNAEADDARFEILKCKEIENILSKDIISNIVGEYEGNNSAHLTLFRNIEYNDYREQNLGKYIDDLLGSKRKRKHSYGYENTIYQKGEFCDKAIKLMSDSDFSFPMLTIDAQELTKKIVKFISDNN